MDNVKFYVVGGYVRDKLLGVESKDVDYAVEATSFENMIEAIEQRGGRIYVSHPKYLTVRAKMDGIDADFVLCRKDGEYIDGRRPESVEPGTIFDDLARRDFTINAIAMDEGGRYIDPYNGIGDIGRGVIRTVGKARDRFDEDTLRILRALRFSVTKGMNLSEEIEYELIYNMGHYAIPFATLATERIREELIKMFKHDTFRSMMLMTQVFPSVGVCVFDYHPIWLEPTMKGR